MSHILDHSIWAVRKEVVGTIRRMLAGGVPEADMRRLLDDPQAAEARVRSAEVSAEDLPRVGSVAILSLTGIIQPHSSLLSLLLFGGGGGLQRFRAELRAALADDAIEAIALHVDSPGGRTSLVEETAAEIRAANQVKPIVAVSNTLAASAGYWLASQAGELAVTPSGYVGSIGCYMMHEDWSGWNEQAGIAVTYVHAGKYKVEGNMDEPLSDEAKADWQRDVDGINDRFIRDIALGRGVDENTVRNDFGQGRVLNAPDALAAGMVNRVATFEQAVIDLRARVEGTSPAAAAVPHADLPAPRGGDTDPASASADAEPEPEAAAGGPDPEPETPPATESTESREPEQETAPVENAASRRREKALAELLA